MRSWSKPSSAAGLRAWRSDVPTPVIEIELLDPAEAPRFTDMTFPAYRYLLGLPRGADVLPDRAFETGRPLALAARVGRDPAGLALVRMPLGDDGTWPALL